MLANYFSKLFSAYKVAFVFAFFIFPFGGILEFWIDQRKCCHGMFVPWYSGIFQ